MKITIELEPTDVYDEDIHVLNEFTTAWIKARQKDTSQEELPL